MKDRAYKDRIAEFHKIDSDLLKPDLPLKGLHIELSNVCNHSCLFCANRKMTRKKGFMDEKLLKKLLHEAYDLGFRDVGYYSNGEPFMSKNLSDYIRWAKNIGFTYVYIDTNGAACDFERIREAIDAGLDSIKFSINGVNKETYELIHGRNDFDKVINNLQRTFEYKQKLNRNLNIFVSVAVTKYIENELATFVDFCKQYANDVVTNSVIEMGGYVSEEIECLSTNNTSDFCEGMQIPCYMLWNAIYISWEGYATACCADFQNYFVYADLNESTLKDAWHNEIITDLRVRHLNKDIEGLPCMTCACGRKGKWSPLMKEFATVVEDKTIGQYDLLERLNRFEKQEN